MAGQYSEFIQSTSLTPHNIAIYKDEQGVGHVVYHYNDLAQAEFDLRTIKSLLGPKDWDIFDKKITKTDRDEDEWRIDLSEAQHAAIENIRCGQDHLIKTLRFDEHCFIQSFVNSITHSQDKTVEPRTALRFGPHKPFTTNHLGVFKQAEKLSPYSAEKIAAKTFMSKPQSTSLISREVQPQPFGLTKTTTAGFIFSSEKAAISRRIIYDGGTYTRPYEFYSEEKATEYYKRAIDIQLFRDNESLKKAITGDDSYNEVLARLYWDLPSSSIGIFEDSLQGRATAVFFARLVARAVKVRHEKLIKLEATAKYHTSMGSASWVSNYEVPIIYYLPYDLAKNYRMLTKQQRMEDQKEADAMLNDEAKMRAAFDNNTFAFLILLSPECARRALTYPYEGQPLFIHLIRRGMFDIANELLLIANHKLTCMIMLSNYYKEFGSPFNASDYAVISALNQSNATELVMSLLDCGASLDSTNDYKQNILHLACLREQGPLAADLLKRPEIEALVNQQDAEGATPLILATAAEKKSIVNLLLNTESCDIDAKNRESKSAFVIAAETGQLEMVGVFLASQLKKPGTATYELALKLAASNGHADVITSLLKHMPDLTNTQALIDAMYQTAKMQPSIFSLLVAAKHARLYPKRRSLAKSAASTMLFSAIHAGHRAPIRDLGILGIDFDFRDEERGTTPLCETTKLEHHGQIEELFEYPLRSNLYDSQRATPLFHAAANGDVKTIKLLIDKKGGQINYANQQGKTPLCVAAENGHVDAVKLLIAKGASVYAQSNKGYTAIFYAAAKGHADIVRLLLELGVNPNQKATNGDTVLFIAAHYGYLTIVNTLIDAGAHCAHTNYKKQTALFYAAANGRHKLIKRFAELFNYDEAKLSQQDQLKKSAYDYAPATTKDIWPKLIKPIEPGRIKIELGKLAWSNHGNEVAFYVDEATLLQYRQYWNDTNTDREYQAYELLTNNLFQQAYADDEHCRDLIESNDLTAYRPNHGTVHGLRQRQYQLHYLDLVVQHGQPQYKEAATLLTAQEKAILNLAGFLYRIGRSNEDGHKADATYGPRSITIFKKIAQILEFDGALINSMALAMHPITENVSLDGAGFDGKPLHKAFLIQRLIELGHQTDLVRCKTFANKPALVNSLQTQFALLVTHSHIEQLIETSLVMAIACCRQTGNKVWMAEKVEGYDPKLFVAMSNNPIKALLTIERVAADKSAWQLENEMHNPQVVSQAQFFEQLRETARMRHIASQAAETDRQTKASVYKDLAEIQALIHKESTQANRTTKMTLKGRK